MVHSLRVALKGAHAGSRKKGADNNGATIIRAHSPGTGPTARLNHDDGTLQSANGQIYDDCRSQRSCQPLCGSGVFWPGGPGPGGATFSPGNGLSGVQPGGASDPLFNGTAHLRARLAS